MTEIILTKTSKGQDIFEIRGVHVTFIDELREGVSSRTGNPWAIRGVNVRLQTGNQSDYMRLTFRGEMAKEAGRFVAGTTVLNVKVEFNVSNGKFQSNDINVVEYSLAQ